MPIKELNNPTLHCSRAAQRVGRDTCILGIIISTPQQEFTEGLTCSNKALFFQLRG